MKTLLLSLFAVVSLLGNTHLLFQNDSLISEQRNKVYHQQVRWHLERATAYYRLISKVQIRAGKSMINARQYEWAVEIPHGHESRFINWMQKDNPPVIFRRENSIFNEIFGETVKSKERFGGMRPKEDIHGNQTKEIYFTYEEKTI